jgi:hypothetical protein
MEPEGSLPWSEQSATGSYPQPNKTEWGMVANDQTAVLWSVTTPRGLVGGYKNSVEHAASIFFSEAGGSRSLKTFIPFYQTSLRNILLA